MTTNIVKFDEKMDKLLKTIEKSKYNVLKKFFYYVNDFDYSTYLKKPNVQVYSKMPASIIHKENSHVYRTRLKVRQTEEGLNQIVCSKSLNDIELESMTLEVVGENCKYIFKEGKQKQVYTFKFNDKKIYDFVDMQAQKELEK